MESQKWTAENLAVWYFRLNGFFTIPNFVLHPTRRGSALTDSDIAGVRFPNRVEFPEGLGGDETEFQHIVSTPYTVLAEVKTGACSLNGPWTNPHQRNMDRILGDLGLYPSHLIPKVAEALYRTGFFSGDTLYCSLFCIGNSESQLVRKDFPHVPQKTWTKVSEFIFHRFKIHRRRKTDHGNWDNIGKTLWEYFESSSNSLEDFEGNVRRGFGLPQT